MRIGAPPLQVDILTSVDGVEFDACFAERVEVVIDELPVSIISRERLIENKRATGRTQDLADAEALE